MAAPEPEVELWAVCDTCSRSFFVPSGTVSALGEVTCPVCAESPSRLEQRSGDTVIAVHVVATDALS